MIQIFKHRCNTIESLAQCRTRWGVEIDLRSDVNDTSDLHLSHDAWVKGESFQNWLREFKDKNIQGPIILNTKEDGLETLALKLLSEAGITNYLFLDTTMPTLYKWTRHHKNSNFFMRWSAIEPLELTALHKGYCQWAWVDCFERTPPPLAALRALKNNYKTCLVSPELQGGTEQEAREFMAAFTGEISGVCTKFPELWDSEGQ